MATAVGHGPLPFIRTVACAMLFLVLRLSHGLDKPWPALGIGTRRLIMLLWSNVTSRLSDDLRGRLRGVTEPVPMVRSGFEGEPDIAPEAICLAHCDAPVVSVVIPTYGQLRFTLRCLASIQTYTPAVPIEVVVVDDAFPGDEAATLARLQGVRLLRNTVNLGFLRSCNVGADAARGKFLLFLNNDTEIVSAEWLDSMVEVFATRPDTGIVGSKLLGADGRLQEAGSIVWNDGSAWNYGRDCDPDAPEFNYLREVDYCSGASLLVRRNVFLEVGGFDEKFAPAYCEDADLSFRLRLKGLQTVYQPRSEIVHFEGASHGRDLRSGVKACQVTNQARFLETWRAVLTHQHYAQATHVLRARDRARRRQVVLIIDHYVPQPDRDAGSRTMVTFIRALLRSGLAVKFWPFNQHRTPGYTEALQDIGVEVLHSPHQTALSDWLKVNGADLDIVLLSRPDVAELCLHRVRAGTSAKIAYYGHDLHFRRLEAEALLTGNAAQRRAARTMQTVELGVWHEVDLVLYPSEEEAAVVRTLAPSATVRAVTPYAFHEAAESPGAVATSAETTDLADPRRAKQCAPGQCEPDQPWIVFVAGFGHPPNAVAASWFVHEVMPAILLRAPTARLAIVGSNPPDSVRHLCNAHVSLFANVTDPALLAWYQRAAVAVVPLLTGAGVKLKTVEAMWHGVPAVLTPAGAQGLPGIGMVAAVETGPCAFAAAVADLLTDSTLRRQRRAAQMGYARDRFSAAAQTQSLLNALTLIGLRPPGQSPPPAQADRPAESCVPYLAVA
jgi:O-antigen biosynthesis protein